MTLEERVAFLEERALKQAEINISASETAELMSKQSALITRLMCEMLGMLSQIAPEQARHKRTKLLQIAGEIDAHDADFAAFLRQTLGASGRD